MGVRARLVVYAPDEPTARRACTAAFQRIARLEDMMSNYRPASELMRLCSQAGGPPVQVSEELFFVLQRALELSQRSEGAFDITVGPYVVLWRQTLKTGQLPSLEELQSARQLVGWQKIRLNPKDKTVQLLVPGMRLDLGGIAKGYAADCALRVLKQHGLSRALVEIGGDIVVGKPPPGRTGWRIDLISENAKVKRRSVMLSHAAISTSGSREQFVEVAGRRYCHIVDPRTGLGITNNILATVIAQDGITADSLSTAACVLGPEKGLALVKSYPGASAYIRQVTRK